LAVGADQRAGETPALRENAGLLLRCTGGATMVPERRRTAGIRRSRRCRRSVKITTETRRKSGCFTVTTVARQRAGETPALRENAGLL
jgi:hypothetical protein